MLTWEPENDVKKIPRRTPEQTTLLFPSGAKILPFSEPHINISLRRLSLTKPLSPPEQN